MEENKKEDFFPQDDMPVEGATEEEAARSSEPLEELAAEGAIEEGAAEEVETAEGPAVAVAEASSDESAPAERKNRRMEKIGRVTSDKMQKTVVVRVERQVQHPKYRRYIRRRSKFMAHDELGARIGDTVRIVETRPMSARKRWRVTEIIQRAR
ncbi:MAG: 30S ribosomal protein S17 [Blastocatellia bacterium]|nr:30S ribosomal protein S17 [Blastocatellia bacterium]